MRLDKYLKLSRIIKRRTLAKKAAQMERVEVNQKLAKPSTTLKLNDLVTLYLGNHLLKVRVLSFEQKKDQLMYELIEEKKLEQGQ